MVGAPQYSGRQKLYSALLVLACQPGPIQERLEAAYRLAIGSVDPQLDIPPEFKSEFQKLRQELHKEFVFRVAHGSDATARKKWATDMATRIVALYDKLARTTR